MLPQYRTRNSILRQMTTICRLINFLRSYTNVQLGDTGNHIPTMIMCFKLYTVSHKSDVTCEG